MAATSHHEAPALRPAATDHPIRLAPATQRANQPVPRTSRLRSGLMATAAAGGTAALTIGHSSRQTSSTTRGCRLGAGERAQEAWRRSPRRPRAWIRRPRPRSSPGSGARSGAYCGPWSGRSWFSTPATPSDVAARSVVGERSASLRSASEVVSGASRSTGGADFGTAAMQGGGERGGPEVLVDQNAGGVAGFQGGGSLFEVVLAQQAGGRAFEDGQVERAVAGEIPDLQAGRGSVGVLPDERQIEDPDEAAVHQIDQEGRPSPVIRLPGNWTTR